MTSVAIIPAKGSSKRIPRKNIKLFHGKPIIAYSIMAAKMSGLFDKVFVSTNDREVSMVASDYGARTLWRPDGLCEIGEPDCGTQFVIRHHLMNMETKYDYACCIYPCAPMLSDLDLHFASKQDQFRYVYSEGVFYYGRAKQFINKPDDFSYSLKITKDKFIDINTESDWIRAEKIYTKLHKVAA